MQLDDDHLGVECVFWEFLERSVAIMSQYTISSSCHCNNTLSSEDKILSVGQWSDRGCNRSESLSNTSVTVCECYHLTHFAILLSPAPLNLTDTVLLSLEIISYVGVSVSLVAMCLTIFTMVFLKYVYF